MTRHRRESLTDKFFVEDAEGNQYYVGYEDLDEDLLPVVLQPIGGFIFEGDAFVQLKLPESPFYIKDWLPKHGKMEIFGSAKAGKSTLAIQMARSIAHAEPFLDMETKTGRVLYLQLELGVEVLQHRLLKTGQNYDNVFFGTTFSMQLDKQTGQDMLKRALEAVTPSVLIIDPWYKIIGGDENEAKDALVITNFLDQMIEAYEDFGLSVVIMHHPGKDISKGGRGSSILEDWVDSYIELRRTSPPNENLRARLSPKLLRHAQVPPEPINIVLTENLEFQIGDAPLYIKDKLLIFAQGREAFRMQEAIYAGIGSKKSVYDARAFLLKESKLVDVGNGAYKKA